MVSTKIIEKGEKHIWKKQKRKMKVMIHTLNIVSDNEPTKNEYLNDCFYKNKKYRSIYNINKSNKIYRYTEFVEKGKRIFSDLQRPYISRIDIAWDSESCEYFERHKKQFRYLLTAFMLAYRSKNSFSVKDLITDEDKSYWVKTSYFDATFYNKGLQVDGKEEGELTQARFELRLKRLLLNGISKIHEIIGIQTRNKLTRALLYLEDVQEEYNKCLIQIYKKGEFRKISELVVFYQDRIFTKNQLINLLNKLDDTNADKKKMAENFAHRYNIKFVTDKEMKEFVKGLLVDMQAFLCN